PFGLDTVVKTDAGYVSGIGGDIRTYKGIPYAAPPVGPLRFAPPQPVKPWENIRSAKAFSATCMQSEDCLTLNVWTPAKTATAKLPVIVWIHGGGFAVGSSAQPGYDGTVMANQGVVVVSLNYRLGQYGFLAHPELSKENPAGVSGNQGMLDMVQGLKWVRANVAAFGGDPNNVTIWGESAGGAAISLLLVMPSSEGLFQKAVVDSPWHIYAPITHLTKTWYGRKSGEAMGAARGSLAALRAQPFDPRGLSIGSAINEVNVGTAAYPVVDGVVIPDDPARLFEQGKFHHVPIIVGGNADDGSIAGARVTNLAQAKTLVAGRLGPASDKILVMYGGTDDASAPAATRKLAGDALFAIAQTHIAQAGAKAGLPVYAYEFARVSPLNRRQNQGATHAADLGYFFGNLPDGAGGGNARPGDFDTVDQRVSSEMLGALVAFAKTGSPNGKGLPVWPRYTLAGEQYLEWNDKTTVKTHMRSDKIQAMWDDLKPRMEANR
ncbi:MAG TPA: carboxylesterase family protein, partial [Caulobacteraceae bacterium]|nr:carboxylesterase family protein [Caulobacteraceae bacterium]